MGCTGDGPTQLTPHRGTGHRACPVPLVSVSGDNASTTVTRANTTLYVWLKCP